MFGRNRFFCSAALICGLVLSVAGCSNPATPTVLVAVSVDSGVTDTKIGDIEVEDGKSYSIEVGLHDCRWNYGSLGPTVAGRYFLKTTTKVLFEATGTVGVCTVE